MLGGIFGISAAAWLRLSVPASFATEAIGSALGIVSVWCVRLRNS